jgi:hypothetical protein
MGMDKSKEKHNSSSAKRNWNGCQKCCFCDANEPVDHLFLSCPFAKLIWRMIFFTYNIPSPANITNIFGNWLNGVQKMDKARIRIGVSAICWSIWTCRNDMIFYKQKGTNFLQVILRAVHWIQLWVYLLPEDQRELMTAVSRLLGGVILGEFKMDSFLLLFIFRWLIHVSTLAFP